MSKWERRFYHPHLGGYLRDPEFSCFISPGWPQRNVEGSNWRLFSVAWEHDGSSLEIEIPGLTLKRIRHMDSPKRSWVVRRSGMPSDS